MMTSIPAFFLDLEAITFVVSLSNLLVFSFMSACGIALRFRDEVAKEAYSSKEIIVWIYFLLSFGVACCLRQGPLWLTITLGSINGCILIVLCFLEQVNKPRRD